MFAKVPNLEKLDRYFNTRDFNPETEMFLFERCRTFVKSTKDGKALFVLLKDCLARLSTQP